MAGWNIPQGALPNRELVAPVVPQPDNTAAKIITENTGTIVNAILRGAAMRNQTQLEEEKMAQDSALTIRGQDISKENNRLDYQAKLKEIEAIAPIRQATNDRRQTAFDQTIEAARIRNEWNASADTHYGNFQTEAAPLGDVELASTQPGQWMAKYADLQNKYTTSVEPRVQNALKDLSTKADQMVVPFASDAQYVDAQDGTGRKIWTNSTVKKGQPVIPAKISLMPVRNIFQQWQDPTQRDYLEKGLIAAGHGNVVDEWKTIEERNLNPFSGSLSRGKKEHVYTPKLDEYGNKLFQGASTKVTSRTGESVPESMKQRPKAEDIKSRVIDPYDPSSSYEPDDGALLPEPDLPPTKAGSSISSPSGEPAQRARTSLMQPTQTDKILDYARKALAYNPANRDEILRRLQGMGISPSSLA